MAKIKSYTDIEQSNELADILPLESADMYYTRDSLENYYCPIPLIGKYSAIHDQITCWSLAALLNVLPNGSDVVKEKTDTENEKYMCTVGVKNDIISTFADNPLDVCYEMIIKLHELKCRDYV